MIWRRLHSRCGVPGAPLKYRVVTMLLALTLQKPGNSTPRCSKPTEPSRQLVITTSRRSQATSSYGWTPCVVQTRSSRKPPAAPAFRSSLPPLPAAPETLDTSVIQSPRPGDRLTHDHERVMRQTQVVW